MITTYNPWGLPEDLKEPSTAAHPNAADRTWTSVYDAGGLLVSDKQPGNVTVTNTYDAMARLTAQSTREATGPPVRWARPRHSIPTAKSRYR